MIVVCLIPLGHYPVFHNRPSYAQEAKSKLSVIKNLCYRYIHNNLSNVVIHMPCINIHHHDRAGHYQLEMIFLHAYVPPITMGNTLHGLDCI